MSTAADAHAGASASAAPPKDDASRALAASLAAKADAAAQKAWLRPALWEGTGPLPSANDDARATFVAWNIRQAWCVNASRDPRDRLDRILSTLDAAHALGVGAGVRLLPVPARGVAAAVIDPDRSPPP